MQQTRQLWQDRNQCPICVLIKSSKPKRSKNASCRIENPHFKETIDFCCEEFLILVKKKPTRDELANTGPIQDARTSYLDQRISSSPPTTSRCFFYMEHKSHQIQMFACLHKEAKQKKADWWWFVGCCSHGRPSVGSTKYCCFLCAWDRRAKEAFFSQKSPDPMKKNVHHLPRVILPPPPNC